MLSGTSMAAPHVTGIAGLLLTFDDTLAYHTVRSSILETVDERLALSGSVATGGRVNALKALCRVSALQGDLSGDGQIDLKDLILSLQILSNQSPSPVSSCIANGVDINGDHRFGMADAVYVLDVFSGLR